MAYTTFEEVQADFKNIVFSTTSLVTSSNVTQFIVEAGALINANVGMKYVVPVTADADSLELLKLFCRTLVADRIKKIMEVKQVTNNSANQEVRGAYSTKDVMAALEKIRKGELALSGATLLVTGGGFFSNNYAQGVAPTVHKDERQW